MNNIYLVMDGNNEIIEQCASKYVNTIIDNLINTIEYLGYEEIDEIQINDFTIDAKIDSKKHKIRFDFVGDYQTIIVDGYETELKYINDYIKCNF